MFIFKLRWEAFSSVHCFFLFLYLSWPSTPAFIFSFHNVSTWISSEWQNQTVCYFCILALCSFPFTKFKAVWTDSKMIKILWKTNWPLCARHGTKTDFTTALVKVLPLELHTKSTFLFHSPSPFSWEVVCVPMTIYSVRKLREDYRYSKNHLKTRAASATCIGIGFLFC